MSNTRRFLVSSLVLFGAATALLAQDDIDPTPGKPLFGYLPNLNPSATPSVGMPEWNGSFVYSGTTYNFSMVGTAPSTNITTTIPVVIIPLKIVIRSLRGPTTFDPATVPSNTGGLTVIQSTVQSPLFDATTTYVQGDVNVGTTQYIDAYQRANFWGTVSSNTSYHLMLGTPTIAAEQTLSVPPIIGKLGTPFGQQVAEVSINWFDSQLKGLIKTLGITPNEIPIFLAYDTYLTQGGCCIGGYHSATGTQSYIFTSYVGQAGQFAQDVSALSHELGEWADDPLINQPNGNQTACGILEVGDPLEGGTNYGGYPYMLHGFTYNLQDLVTLPYFGAPTSTTVNGQFTFQGQTLTVCQNGS